MRRQVERIWRDHAGDAEAAIGQAKDLVETVCKTILGMTGDVTEVQSIKFPPLAKKTLLHLGIDPTQRRTLASAAATVPGQSTAGDHVQVKAAKQVLGGLCVVPAKWRGRTTQRARNRAWPQWISAHHGDVPEQYTASGTASEEPEPGSRRRCHRPAGGSARGADHSGCG